MKYPEFNHVEIAIGDVKNRNQIVTVDEVEKKITKHECYRSMFRFTEDKKNYVNGKPSNIRDSSMKQVSGKEFAKILEQHGWELSRIKGSHYIYE